MHDVGLCLQQMLCVSGSMFLPMSHCCKGNKIRGHKSASVMQLAPQCETLQSLLLVMNATL